MGLVVDDLTVCDRVRDRAQLRGLSGVSVDAARATVVMGPVGSVAKATS